MKLARSSIRTLLGMKSDRNRFFCTAQVEAYRSPVSGKQLQDELRAFMRSRLSSLRVMHGQCVRHFTTLAARKQTLLSKLELVLLTLRWSQG